jgi:hypothetical protein
MSQDHPTRRLPADEGPAAAPAVRPTRRLPDPPPGPRPEKKRCRLCGGEVRRFEARVLAEGAWQAVEVRNPWGGRDIPWIGERPHAPCDARVCMICGYTELFTRNPQQLLAE